VQVIWAPAARVEISAADADRIYEWLEDRAPFIRSQLRARHHGGTADLALRSEEERRAVLAAIKSAGGRKGPLSDGLLQLRDALSATA
jgi:hypothetical protein